jgi:maltokinase
LQQWSEVHNGLLTQAYRQIPGRFLARERWFAERDTLPELVLKTTAQFQTVQKQALYLTLNLYQLPEEPGFFYYLPLLIVPEPLPDRSAFFSLENFYFYDGVPTAEYLALLNQLLGDNRTVVTAMADSEFKFYATANFQAPRFKVGSRSSNSLLFVFPRYLIKNYRRVYPGINPELHLGLALTQNHSDCVPQVLGYFSCSLEHTAEYTLGLLQELVDHRGTGWAVWGHLLENPGADGRYEIERQAETLGRTLAELHRELAGIAASTGRQTEFNRRLLEERIAKITVSAEQELTGVAPDLVRRVREKLRQIQTGITGAAGLGRLFHVHGDLHLEQVLQTETGWKVIDFEGEPLKTIMERESYESPLKDLAALLRSVSYRVNTVTVTAAAELENVLQSALVIGYRAGYNEYQGEFLPAGGNFLLLLDLFQLERVVYELGYEARYRPEWLHIPLAGLAKLAMRSGKCDEK